MRPKWLTGAFVACVAAQSAFAFGPLSGLSLSEAIERLDAAGLRIFYSTDLIRPWMTVEVEPASDDPAVALDRILAPAGLRAKPGPGGSLLVVRDASPPTGAPESTDVATRPDRTTNSPGALEEIVVAASQYELRRATPRSRRRLSQRDLEYLPELGEDALRTVSRLPGTASNGIGALASVRGGELRETLIRLDGLRLFEPFHLKDFQNVFSVVDPRVVSSIDVYTGGFPAMYGNGMSGVLDINTMVPPDDLYHELGLSFFNLSMLSSGRYREGQGRWLLSARRSNLDLLYESFTEQPDRPRYTDLFGKLAYRPGEKLDITASVLRAEDDIALSDDSDREETARTRHRDVYAWVTLDHALGDKVNGRTIVARYQADGTRYGTTDKDGISAGTLAETRTLVARTIKSEWTLRLNDRLSLSTGAGLTASKGTYEYSDDVEFDLQFDVAGAEASRGRARSVSAEPRERHWFLYGSFRYDWTDRFATELGARWDSQSVDGVRHQELSPRFGVYYSLSPALSFRASIGRVFQLPAIHELQASDGEQRFFEPQFADHFVIGLEQIFDSGMNLRLEAYVKEVTNPRPRYENLLNTLVLLPELKPDRVRIAPEAARVEGLELAIDGPPGPVQWWISYTWSCARDSVMGENVARSWDQPRALSAGISWDTPKWNTSAVLTHRSGWPTTAVVFDDSGAVPVVRADERNRLRMDSFRSMDIRVTRKIALAHGSLDVSLELSNALGRTNPCCTEFEVGDEDEGDLALERLDYLPTIPSLGVLWRF